MISLVLPFFNSENYLLKAIQSVSKQPFKDCEILLINDGSTDNSKQIALSFQDSRIRYFEQENRGAAAARNVGLANMKGDYFCFLDADDVLTPNSLQIRLQKFQENPHLAFVDGEVIKYNADLSKPIAHWKPSLVGNPLRDLVRLNGKPFFSPTWLIKRKPNVEYCFKEGLTHGEDLLFFMELSRTGGLYDYVQEPILHYRDTPGSAMKNLKGLEKGYRAIEQEIKAWPELQSADLLTYRLRWRKFMAFDYLKRKDWASLARLLG